MSPGHKRQIVESLVIAGRCSGRTACRHFGLHRSTFSYEAKEPDAWLARLKAILRRLSNQSAELGYAKITCFLKEEGWKVGTRMVQRLRRDTTVRGCTLRMLNVMDEYTRECLCIHVERRINARKVRQVMARLIEEHGAPEHIRSDNGSEFIERGLREWLAENKIRTLYIAPGSPWQNGYIEPSGAR